MLHGAGPAVADRFAQQLAIKHQPAPAQLQDGHLPADVQYAQHAAQCFADHGGKGAAVAAPVQHLHKEQVAADVQHRADHQEIQGTLAVAQCTHGGGKEVIEEGEDQACKHDAQVVHRNGQDIGGHLHQLQQGRGQNDAQRRECQREHGACNGGGGHLTLHQLGITGTECGTDQNAGTQTHAVDKQDGQSHERVGGADGGKGFLAHELAHDDAVGGVVGELEQVAKYQRNGKTDQERSNGSLCHVVCHGNSMISPYNVFTICRPGRMARAERLAPTWMSCAAACKTAPDATEAGMASVRSTFCAARCASVVFTATTLSTT